MKVFIGVVAVYLIAGLLLGGSIYLIAMKGLIWPFAVVLIGCILTVKATGCSTH